MSAANDGGPAFPCSPGYGIDSGRLLSGHEGLSIRDWFAGQTLTALLLAPANDVIREEHEREMSWGELVAHRAYLQADALLAERSKP